MVFVAKNNLRSDLRLYNVKKISWRECAPVSLADVCYTRTECAHAVPTYLTHPGYASVVQVNHN